jgi:hypothetical protein
LQLETGSGTQFQSKEERVNEHKNGRPQTAQQTADNSQQTTEMRWRGRGGGGRGGGTGGRARMREVGRGRGRRRRTEYFMRLFFRKVVLWNATKSYVCYECPHETFSLISPTSEFTQKEATFSGTMHRIRKEVTYITTSKEVYTCYTRRYCQCAALEDSCEKLQLFQLKY